MDRRKSLLSLLCRLFVVSTIALQLVPSIQEDRVSAAQTNPCSRLPLVCHYTYDPVENCCVADPRFDCYDACF